MSDQDWEEATHPLLRPLSQGHIFHEEMRLRRKDGSPMFCDVQAQAIDPQDLGKGSIWTGIDITVTAPYRRTIGPDRANLEQLVLERTEEDCRTVQALEETAAQQR